VYSLSMVPRSLRQELNASTRVTGDM
jgi:hypothetical protein